MSDKKIEGAIIYRRSKEFKYEVHTCTFRYECPHCSKKMCSSLGTLYRTKKGTLTFICTKCSLKQKTLPPKYGYPSSCKCQSLETCAICKVYHHMESMQTTERGEVCIYCYMGYPKVLRFPGVTALAIELGLI